MKYCLVFLLLTQTASAEVWGRLMLVGRGGTPARVTIHTKKSGGLLEIESQTAGKSTTPLNASQFANLTGWLSAHFLHEQELRNRRHEKVTCAAAGGKFNLEPELFQIQLCRGIARHEVLLMDTAETLSRFLKPQLVAKLF